MIEMNILYIFNIGLWINNFNVENKFNNSSINKKKG